MLLTVYIGVQLVHTAFCCWTGLCSYLILFCRLGERALHSSSLDLQNKIAQAIGSALPQFMHAVEKAVEEASSSKPACIQKGRRGSVPGQLCFSSLQLNHNSRLSRLSFGAACLQFKLLASVNSSKQGYSPYCSLKVSTQPEISQTSTPRHLLFGVESLSQLIR